MTTAYFTPLCKCLNCDTIFEDMNPQTNQPEFLVEIGQYDTLAALLEDGGRTTYYGCPNCNTDGYLTDILTDDMLNS